MNKINSFEELQKLYEESKDLLQLRDLDFKANTEKKIF